MAESIQLTNSNGVLIIKVLLEEIDIANVSKVRKEFEAADTGTPVYVVVDLSDVKFIDSSAIGWVIALHQNYKKNNIKVAVAANSPELKEVFALTYIDKLIDIFESVDAAVGAH